MQNVNTNAVARLLVLIVGVVLSIALLYLILESKATGAVAALIFIVGAVGAIVSVINPRAGLVIVVIEGVFLDFFKKVAVTFGEPTLLTVIQVLVVSLLTLSCVYLGIFLRMLLKVIPVKLFDLILFAVCGGAIGFFFVSEPAGTMGRVQSGLNGGLYLGLVPAIAILLKTREEIIKLLKLFFWCMVPFATWAIYQAIFGFTDMEWNYANTWLSPVSSGHMLMQAHPRPFGLASGPSGYNSVSFFPLLGLYFACTVKNGRVWYLLAVALMFWGILCVEQRTTLVLPFICGAFYLFAIEKRRLVIAYAAVALLIFSGIASSKYLLENLEDWTYEIQVFVGSDAGNLDDWRNRVFVFNSFADRLMGWQRLMEPKSYSLLGRLGGSGAYVTKGLGDEAAGGEEYAHDVINKVLIQAGVVGVVIFLTVGITFLIMVHRLHLQIRDRRSRRLATLLAAIIMPALVIQTMAGLTLTTNPINLVVWTFAGCLFALSRIDRAAAAREIPDSPSAEIADSTPALAGPG